MEWDANDLLLFVSVIDAASFSRAAERTGLPKSTISRRISLLEQRLGERLITRTTRRLTMTDFGQTILDYARRMAEESAAVTAFAQHRKVVPSGRLRVSMPPDFSELVLAPFFLQFTARYPEIRLELDLSARRVDLLVEQFDLAIRIAAQLPDDGTLIARKIYDMPGGLYASPAYLRHYGTPEQPDDLSSHTALHLLLSNGEKQPWKLHKGEARWEGMLEGQLAVNSVSLIRLLATHGLGIAQLSQRLAQAMVDQGLIVRVLPDWQMPAQTIWGVMPGRRLLPSRTRVFLDALIETLENGSEPLIR